MKAYTGGSGQRLALTNFNNFISEKLGLLLKIQYYQLLFNDLKLVIASKWKRKRKK